MIAHYLAVALAKFRKSPFTTAANVLTLALGLACFVAAWGIADYWRSADDHHPNADRLYFVSQYYMRADGARPSFGDTASAPRLAADLREDVSEIEAVARVNDGISVAISVDGEASFLQLASADPQIFDLLSFDFIEGASETALTAPESIVLVQEAAQRLFGNEPAVGKKLLVDNRWEAVVSGVIAPVQQPSFLGHTDRSPLYFEAIGQIDFSLSSLSRTLPPGVLDGYNFRSSTTIVRLPPTMSRDAFAARLNSLIERRVPLAPDGVQRTVMTPVPLAEITTRLVDEQLASGATLGSSVVVVLPLFGLLILVIACVNYTNLAATQAMARAKEVGMRAVLGARKLDLLAQHWLEAALVTLAALALAIAAVAAAAPVIARFIDADAMRFLKVGLSGALFVATVGLVTSALAAIYPTMALSRVRPAEALGAGRRGPASGLAGRIFVGLQFLSASFLLITVTVMSLQTSWMRQVAIDSRAPIVVLGPLGRAGIETDTLRTRLTAYPQIESMTLLNFPPWTDSGITTGLGLSPELGGSAGPAWMKTVDYNYFETLNQNVIAGRVFDRDHEAEPKPFIEASSADPVPLVIDEDLAERLGFPTPQAAIGATIYQPAVALQDGLSPARAAEIIGVVETDATRLRAGPRGAAYQFDPVMATSARVPALRVSPDDVPGALAAIGRVWAELAPDIPLTANLYGDLFELGLAPFKRIQITFVGLAAFAFAISTTGLLGVAAHAAARRRHEIGVRKTLGSTTLGIIRLLLVDFAKPALTGNLIAWPLAYLAVQTYLSAFADRIPLTPAPFALSMAITLLIAWAAVLGEVLKAARVRPAEVLRHA